MKQTKSYLQFVADLKNKILQSRYQAARLANREQLLLYFETGKMLSQKVSVEKWGSKIIEQISFDLQNLMPGLRGFSSRNLKKMRQFYETYRAMPVLNVHAAQSTFDKNKSKTIGPSLTAQLDAFFGISFSHHILILSKCKKSDERLFYINICSIEFWSVEVLEYKINSKLFDNQGKLPNNFSKTISKQLNPSALKIFNDEYLLDYMNLDGNENEKQVEASIVNNIRDFVLRMGTGFSFIGNQFRLELDGDEFFIDLLFFNRQLQCLVAFELKQGKFKPEYAGQLNFYLNLLDEKVRLPHENFSIGIILCKEKNNTVVEYSVRNIDRAMGVATFITSKSAPKELKKVLPDTDKLIELIS